MCRMRQIVHRSGRRRSCYHSTPERIEGQGGVAQRRALQAYLSAKSNPGSPKSSLSSHTQRASLRRSVFSGLRSASVLLDHPCFYVRCALRQATSKSCPHGRHRSHRPVERHPPVRSALRKQLGARCGVSPHRFPTPTHSVRMSRSTRPSAEGSDSSNSWAMVGARSTLSINLSFTPGLMPIPAATNSAFIFSSVAM